MYEMEHLKIQWSEDDRGFPQQAESALWMHSEWFSQSECAEPSWEVKPQAWPEWQKEVRQTLKYFTIQCVGCMSKPITAIQYKREYDWSFGRFFSGDFVNLKWVFPKHLQNVNVCFILRHINKVWVEILGSVALLHNFIKPSVYFLPFMFFTEKTVVGNNFWITGIFPKKRVL